MHLHLFFFYLHFINAVSELVNIRCYQCFLETEPPIAVASCPSKRVPVNCTYPSQHPLAELTVSSAHTLTRQIRCGR